MALSGEFTPLDEEARVPQDEVPPLFAGDRFGVDPGLEVSLRIPEDPGVLHRGAANHDAADPGALAAAFHVHA